jgi:hypothetical protein
VPPASEDSAADRLAALPPRSGHRRRPARAAGRVIDLLLDARQAGLRVGGALDRAAGTEPRSEVAAYAVYGPGGAAAISDALAELRRSRHEVSVTLGSLGRPAHPLEDETALAHLEGGKLANLNRLLDRAPPAGADWVLILDDDVALGRRFLDRMLLLAERFELDLAQPALSHTSHTAWPVTRRRGYLLRRTRFVEMGPVLLIRRHALAELVPFPQQGMGWGACLHWAAVAERRGWRLGIADAVPVRHDLRPPASGYDRAAAREAGAALLREREHIDWRDADLVLAAHRRL